MKAPCPERKVVAKTEQQKDSTWMVYQLLGSATLVHCKDLLPPSCINNQVPGVLSNVDESKTGLQEYFILPFKKDYFILFILMVVLEEFSL